VETVLETYLELRDGPDDRFIDVYRRVGHEPFKAAVYGGGALAREFDDAVH